MIEGLVFKAWISTRLGILPKFIGVQKQNFLGKMNEEISNEDKRIH